MVSRFRFLLLPGAAVVLTTTAAWSIALRAQQPAETTIPDKVRLFIPYK